jgi:hypothetical protein
VRNDPPGVTLDVLMSWSSDGARGQRSLDWMEYVEHLLLTQETGGMVGKGLGSHGLAALADEDKIDQHGTPRKYLKSVGRQELLQVHSFTDHRTGADKIAVTNSGFSVILVVEPDTERPGCLRFVITKSGKAGTVDGIVTGAGSGMALAVVALPCGPGGPTPGGGGGGGGGPDSTPSTSVIPVPFMGPVPPLTVPFFYVSGVPLGARPFDMVLLVIAFRAHSTDPSRPGSRVFTAPIPCMVPAANRTTVSLRTVNTVPLSLAPPDYTLAVMPPLNLIDIPKSLLR